MEIFKIFSFINMAIQVFNVFIIMFILSLVSFNSLNNIDGKQLVGEKQKDNFVFAWRCTLASVIAGLVYFGSHFIKI